MRPCGPTEAQPEVVQVANPEEVFPDSLEFIILSTDHESLNHAQDKWLSKYLH